MDLRLGNLACVWPNLRSAGVAHVVLAGAIDSDALLDRMNRALGDIHPSVVRLQVKLSTVEARLRQRDKGAVLEAHLKIASEISRSLDRACIEDLCVWNEGHPVEEVAREILQRMGWLGATPGTDPES